MRSSARKNLATWRGRRFWRSWFVCRRISDISSSSFLEMIFGIQSKWSTRSVSDTLVIIITIFSTIISALSAWTKGSTWERKVLFKRTFRSQVLLKPGLLLPQEVERGGDFYLTAMVEHVQGEQEEVEYTEQGQDENTVNKVKLKILKLRNS